MLKQSPVKIIPTQRGVAPRGHDFEDTAAKLQDRDIKGATAEVINDKTTLSLLIKPISDCRGRRLVQKTQDRDASQTSCILRGLALSIIKVGRDSDHRAHDFLMANPERIRCGAESLLSAFTQGL